MSGFKYCLEVKQEWCEYEPAEQQEIFALIWDLLQRRQSLTSEEKGWHRQVFTNLDCYAVPHLASKF